MRWFAFAFVAVALSAEPAHAVEEEIVQPASANLREGPSEQNAVVGRVRRFAVVQIHERKGKWERVTISGDWLELVSGKPAGWIRSDLTLTREESMRAAQGRIGDAFESEGLERPPE